MGRRSLFVSQLCKSYPKLESDKVQSLVADNMISDFNIELPAQVLDSVRKTVEAFQALRDSTNYQNHLRPTQAQLGIKDCGHNSVMMSYDFHLTEDNQLKLIEINTNAAFHLLGLEMYEALGLDQPWSNFKKHSFREMISEEITRAKITPQGEPKVFITDAEPDKQRLYIEFLAYQELFRQYGWTTEIIDTASVQDSLVADFIYNRHTDFYFAEPETRGLRALSYSGKTCVSPHPYEYLLLADKERMTLWSQPGFLEELGLPRETIDALQKVLPQAVPLNRENADKLWQERKKFFFKPMRAFGSKQSFKGASISRKAFDELLDQDILAQEFVPAPTRNLLLPTGESQEFKFDLRCYAYRNQLQSIVARIYQGQVTNLRTPHGGFAPVLFS